MRSDTYWEARYANGGDSGAGSRGQLAQRKAEYVNALVDRYGVRSVVDWGCGNGAQLALLNVPAYVGVDTSATAIRACLERFPERQFVRCGPRDKLVSVRAEMSLSMDVVYHLPDDIDYRAHLDRVFGSAARLAVVYATDYDDTPSGHHMRRRRWTPDVETEHGEWDLVERPDDPHTPGFYVWRMHEA